MSEDESKNTYLKELKIKLVKSKNENRIKDHFCDEAYIREEGCKTQIKTPTIDVKQYAKYLLQEGSRDEKTCNTWMPRN
jgi:hypothetical protein